MAKHKPINLQFPLGGLDRGGIYREQSPFTTPDCVNVQPNATLEGRARGGSRPGLGKAYEDRLGTAGTREIRMLAPVTVVANDGFTWWQDNFNGSDLGEIWSAASWVANTPSILPENLASSSYNTEVAAIHDELDLDTSASHELAIFIAPWENAHNGTFRIYGRLNNTTPLVTTDGFVAEITMTGSDGKWTGSLTVYNATSDTTYTFTAGTDDLGAAMAGWFVVLVDESDNIKCYWRGQELLDQNCTFGGNAEYRFGFGMNCTVNGGYCLVDVFRSQYYLDDSNDRRRTITVASANGSLYEEGLLGNMDTITTDLTLASDRRIDAAQRAQVLYIADHGDPVIDTTSSVSGSTLTASGIAAATVNKDDCVVELSNVTGDTTAGVYAISSVGSGTLVLASAPGNGTCKARIERGAKSYTPSTQTLALITASAGMIPVGCPHICTYRDRLVLGMDHIAYYSRMGDFTDWDYGADADDVGKAYISTSSEAGQIGDIITALIPFSDDYLIFGCKSSLWIQLGDLAAGGSIDNITNHTSIIMRGAWAKGPAGSVFFLGPDGINFMQGGSRPFPQNLSQNNLPRELRDIDTNVYQIAMAYDNRRQGLNIYLTPTVASGRKHWFYSLPHNSFWAVELNGDHEPTSIIDTSGYSGASVLLGCRDGYIRHYNDLFETDDGEEISSYVDIGPFKLGDDINSGILHELISSLAQNSGNLTWSVRLGDTAEAVSDSTTNFATGTWIAGRNYPAYVRGYGQYAVVRVAGESASMRKWALERITATRSKQGMAR